MRIELEEKVKAFKESSFENKEFRAWLKESDIWMAVYSCMRIRGIEMDKRQLVDVLNGKIMEDLPLDIYGFVHNFKDLYKDMQACISMQESLDEKLLARFYDMIIGGAGFRKDNSVIYKWGYIAPHFNEISDDLKKLFNAINHESNAIDRAVAVHNGIASIYPYGEDSPTMAMVAALYELMKAEIPLPSITVDNEDYDHIMAEYFDKKTDGFREMLERSLMNRMEQVMLFGIESQER